MVIAVPSVRGNRYWWFARLWLFGLWDAKYITNSLCVLVYETIVRRPQDETPVHRENVRATFKHRHIQLGLGNHAVHCAQACLYFNRKLNMITSFVTTAVEVAED